jgi:hypothetical protein
MPGRPVIVERARGRKRRAGFVDDALLHSALLRAVVPNESRSDEGMRAQLDDASHFMYFTEMTGRRRVLLVAAGIPSWEARTPRANGLTDDDLTTMALLRGVPADRLAFPW